MRLILGDCAEKLKELESESIDMVLTSPPYDDMDENFNSMPKNGLRRYKGYSWDFKTIAQELFRAMKKGGVLVWVVNDPTIKGSESLVSSLQKIYFRKVGFNIHDTMIYEKTGCAMPSPNRYLASFEYMLVLSKEKPKAHNLIEDRKNRFPERWGGGRKVRNKDGTWSYRNRYVAKEYGRRFNVWRYNNGGQGYGHSDGLANLHPATFPEKLAEDHILSWSNPNDVVLDPMMGSGTTGKIAVKNGRDFIGIEISEEYLKIAEERIKLASPK